jgi:hypothetical protein
MPFATMFWLQNCCFFYCIGLKFQNQNFNDCIFEIQIEPQSHLTKSLGTFYLVKLWIFLEYASIHNLMLFILIYAIIQSVNNIVFIKM